MIAWKKLTYGTETKLIDDNDREAEKQQNSHNYDLKLEVLNSLCVLGCIWPVGLFVGQVHNVAGGSCSIGSSCNVKLVIVAEAPAPIQGTL